MTKTVQGVCSCHGRNSNCTICNGTGRRELVACRRCSGTGKEGSADCLDCRGQGWRDIDQADPFDNQ